jgi:RHS repeat-associated protein
MTKRTDEMGKATTYTYDNIDRILTITLPKPTSSSTLEFKTTYTYDVYDPSTQLVFVQVTDPSQRVTKSGYDVLGNLIKTIDALQHETAYAYIFNLLKSITDANGNQTVYTYDSERQLASTIFPDGQVETYTRGEITGRVEKVLDRRGNQIEHRYDALGRLTSTRYSTPPNTITKNIQYGYSGQKLTSVTDTLLSPSRIYEFTHDAMFRVASEGYSGDTKIEYTYVLPNGHAISTQVTRPPFGNNDRVTTVNYDGWGQERPHLIGFDGAPPEVEIEYNGRGQYSSMEFSNSMVRSYTYDDQGRVTKIEHTHPTAGTIAKFEYAYDYDWPTSSYAMLGQRTSMTTGGQTTKYHYDAAYQLIEEFPTPFYTRWEYDAIGNRTLQTSNTTGTKIYQYHKNGSNTANSSRLKQVGTAAVLTYDSNGNLQNDATWDIANRLTQHGTVTFEYDWQSRRTKRLNAKYTYVGQNVVRIRDTTAGVLDDFIFGNGIDEPLMRKDASGARFYYIVDGLGSVVAEVNATGAVIASRTYDAWGRTTTPPTFGYTGREPGNSVLLYYRARYYDSVNGRFISEDPIFDPNTTAYAYALNDPILASDPLGLYAIGKSCNCQLGDKFYKQLQTQTDAWCEHGLPAITNPTLRKCLAKRCNDGNVECKENCPKNEAGYNMWFSNTANICTFGGQTQTYAPPGDVVIHEWAHSCGWKENSGQGVPDYQ